MDTDLFNFLTTQGSFALLFGYLLLYVLKQNQIREENYQKIIEQLNNALPTIKTDLEDIKKMIMQLTEVIRKGGFNLNPPFLITSVKIFSKTYTTF